MRLVLLFWLAVLALATPAAAESRLVRTEGRNFVAPDGSVLVVDQVNRRIQRFSRGVMVSSLGLPSATTQDVAVSRDGTVVSLDRLVAREARVHFANGETRTAPVEVGPIREGGAVSGPHAESTLQG